MLKLTLTLALFSPAAAFVPSTVSRTAAAGRASLASTVDKETETTAGMDLDLDDMNSLFDAAVDAESGSPKQSLAPDAFAMGARPAPSASQMAAAAERAERETAEASGASNRMLAIPFLPSPPMLDGTLAGDVGFDPAGFANSRAELYNLREAEVKHGRLAMLAAVGWPLAELWDGTIAKTLGLPSPVELNGGLSPSVLNGGLGSVSPLYWGACVGLAAAVDLYGQSVRAKAVASDANWMISGSYMPGDLGFDPLGLYPADGAGRRRMQLAEIKHGRLAMIAVTAYAAAEAVSKVPVVGETPFLFKPFFA